MKKITTLVILLFAIGLHAQTTHNINWFVGATPGTTTIEEGDTVNWMWTDNASHTVTNSPGSTDTFDSGVLPSGSTYSRDFPDAGTNPYFCAVHPSMEGVIEVEPVLGIDENDVVSFTYYPNPVKDYFMVDAQELITTMQIYSINGKLLMDAPINNTSANTYIGVFREGTYFVTVNFENSKKTIQIVLKK